MTAWTKRETVGHAAGALFSDIWDSDDGWQVNKSVRDGDDAYVLIDALMPMIPASSVMGHFATLGEAQSEAERLGPPDWSEVNALLNEPA